MKPDSAQQRGNEPGRTRGSRRFLVLLFILGVGAVVVALLLTLRTAPQPAQAEAPVPWVLVRRATVADVPVTIRASGVVSPKVEVDVVPEVAGRAVFVHAELKTGGLIPAHEQILQIDPLDCELAARRARAAVDEAQATLDIMTAGGRIQRRLDFETETDAPLAAQEPQVRLARAALESARTQLATAELRLQRTAISLPFDVLIAGEQVDLGHYVVAGQAVARVYGVDAFEIEVGLSDKELALIDGLQGMLTPGEDSAGPTRIAAAVKAAFAGREHTWEGYIVRAAGRVDEGTGQVPVIVEVPRPLDAVGDRPPLLPGTSVQVVIAGGMLKQVAAVPREAIRSGKRIWLVHDGRLRLQELDIVHADEELAYARSGVAPGDEIVVGPADELAEGMQVRTRPAGTRQE